MWQYLESLNGILVIVFFWLTFAGVLATFAIALILKPKSRLEWATLGLFASFFMVMSRAYILGAILHRTSFPQPWGALFWLVQCALVLNYVVALFLEWQPMAGELRAIAFDSMTSLATRIRREGRRARRNE